eukprot:gene4408-7277_t
MPVWWPSPDGWCRVSAQDAAEEEEVGCATNGPRAALCAAAFRAAERSGALRPDFSPTPAARDSVRALRLLDKLPPPLAAQRARRAAVFRLRRSAPAESVVFSQKERDCDGVAPCGSAERG